MNQKIIHYVYYKKNEPEQAMRKQSRFDLKLTSKR